MHGDESKSHMKKMHKKLRHPKGKHKKNHMGSARDHKHLDGVRHHMAGEHSPRTLHLGELGGDLPKKPHMSLANEKRKSARRDKRLAGVPL